MHLLPKIAHAIDRWLASPHRALATWIILEILSIWMLVILLVTGAFFKLWSQWSAFLASFLPFPASGALNTAIEPAVLVFFLQWYRPLVLRLGLWRWIAWIAAATALGMGTSLVSPTFFASPWFRGTIIGPVFGLPFLLIAGRRTPAVRAVFAASLVWTAWIFFDRISVFEGAVSFALVIVADLAAVVLLLYGTKPIVRGTPSGGEGTPSVPRDTASLGGES